MCITNEFMQINTESIIDQCITWEQAKHRAIRLSKREKQLILKTKILADVIQWKIRICILFTG